MKMENSFFNSDTQILDQVDSKSLAKNFMANVFAYMFGALAITGVIAWYFSRSEALLQYIINPTTGAATPLFYIAAFAPLGLVFLMSLGQRKMSAPVLLAVYLIYSALNGIAFSTLFLFYPVGTIYVAFGVTALTFGVMSVVGYTTSTDLTKLGGILSMALIGIIIAMIVNWFVGSSQIDYIISIFGVIIFTGLTAYDVQKLKRIGAGVEYESASSKKLAIMGALDLYLDFINLFLFLLRLMSSRD